MLKKHIALNIKNKTVKLLRENLCNGRDKQSIFKIGCKHTNPKKHMHVKLTSSKLETSTFKRHYKTNENARYWEEETVTNIYLTRDFY